MKRFAAALLALCLFVTACAALTSCNQTSSPETTQTETQEKVETTEKVETDEKTETTQKVETSAPTETTEPAPTETTEPAPTETTEPATTETTEPATTETTEPATTETTEPATTETTEPATTETTEPATTETTEPATTETTESATTETTEPATTETTEPAITETTEPATTETTEPSEQITADMTEETTEGQTAGSVVEASEWEKLFDTDNLTIHLTAGENMYQCFMFGGNNLYTYSEYDGWGYCLYYEFVTVDGEEICYIYDQILYEGDFEFEVDDRNSGERTRDILNAHFYPFAQMFDSFTYDAENEQYVAESLSATVAGQEYTYNDVCVKIKGGKLVEITYIWNENNLSIVDVNDTVVTIPTVTYTVSEQEWDDIMTSDTLDNSVINLDSKREDGEYINADQFKFAPNAMEVGGGVYLLNIDGVWHMINRDWDNHDGAYVVVPCSKDDYTFKSMVIGYLEGKYSSFEFDEQNRCYVATDITMGDNLCSEVRVYIRNGQFTGMEQITTTELDGEQITAINTYYVLKIGDVKDEDVTCNIPDFTVSVPKLDQAEWNEAFAALENVEIKVVQDMYGLVEGEWILATENEKVEDYVISENGYLRSSQWCDIIYVCEGNVCYEYSIYHTNTEPVWERRAVNEIPSITSSGPIVALIQTAEKFALFSYDKDSGLYVASDVVYDDENEDTELVFETVTIGFENGNISSFCYVAVSTINAGGTSIDIKQVIKFTFDKYGEAVFEIPSEFIEE